MIRAGDWPEGWTEARDIADQVEEANAAWRDEIATQRAQDEHLIIDDRPTRLECEMDERR